MTTGDRVYGGSAPTIAPGSLSDAGGGLADGTAINTASPRAARWTLARDYPAAPDGIRAVAAVGGGAWVRDMISGAPGANLVANYYVDQGAGDDVLGDGLTPGTAVASLEEVMARLGQQPVGDELNPAGMIVSVAAGYVSAAKLVLSPRIERGGYLTVLGTPTVVDAGTLSSHTAWNPAAGTIGSYTVAGFSPGSYVGSLLRNGGGLTSPIESASGATFRGLFCDQASLVSAEPTDTDVLEVLSLCRVNADLFCAPTGDGQLILQGLDLGVAGVDHSVALVGNTLFLGSIVHGLDAQRTAQTCNVVGCYTLDCRAHGCQMLVGASVHASAGGASLAVDNSGTLQVLDLALSSGTVQAGRTEEGVGTLVVGGSGALAVADYSGAGVLVRQGSQVDVYNYLFLRDAVGGAYGYQVFNGGRLYYVSGKLPAFYGTAPAATGYRLGGADVASASLPTVTAGGAAFELMQ